MTDEKGETWSPFVMSKGRSKPESALVPGEICPIGNVQGDVLHSLQYPCNYYYYYYYYYYYKCHGLQCCHHTVSGALYKVYI